MGYVDDSRRPPTRFGPKPKAEPFVPWKPDVCEEPGCKRRHPSFSRNGREGPWRCGPCDKAPRKARKEPIVDLEPPPAPPDRLL